MGIRRAPDGAETVVTVRGDVDITTVDELDRAVREELVLAPVLLDLRGVTFMDSSGLRILDALVRDGHGRPGALRIDPELSDSVLQLLNLTGMIEILPLAAPGERR